MFSDYSLIQGRRTDRPAISRDHAERLYESWIDEGRGHAERFGVAHPDRAADTLFVVMQGGWQLARARRDSNVLRRLPEHVPWDRFQPRD